LQKYVSCSAWEGREQRGWEGEGYVWSEVGSEGRKGRREGEREGGRKGREGGEGEKKRGQELICDKKK